MNLKYILVRQELGWRLLRSRERKYLFIVSPEEEARLCNVIADQAGGVEIILHKPLVTESLEELDGILQPDMTVAIASKSVGDPSVDPKIDLFVFKSHLRGVRILEFEVALMELSSSVPSDPRLLLQTLAKGCIHQDWGIRAYGAIKNILEPLVAAALLVLLAPLLFIVAILIKVTSAGPLLYHQTRVGLNGKPFEIFKFRSMRVDAEKDGPVWSSANGGDSRLSPIGNFLRVTHLDELPQFFNILRGELSFIGPRPERPVFVEQLEKKIPLFRLRELIKPGITGWAQIKQGYANSVEDSRKKLELDLYYQAKRSLSLDILIAIQTLSVLFTGGTEGRKRRRTEARHSRVTPIFPRSLTSTITQRSFNEKHG